MKVFSCPTCGNEVWFDTLVCAQCSTDLSYDPTADAFAAATAACANRPTVERCNWQRAPGDEWCESCTLDQDHRADTLRRPFQLAKRRTLRQLRRRGILVADRRPPLRFALRRGTEEEPVMTGHEDGLITLNTAEAEPARLEEVRTALGEPYRTPLGHVRHELGHWWWASAVGAELDVEVFRARFGDERADYAAALEAHYSTPDDGSWRDEFVSYYAASHPWEDFAESFAHVLHIDDTFETAWARGVVDGEGIECFRQLYERWVPFTLTLNEINRSMGTPDPYPFVIARPALDKIELVAAGLPGAPPPPEPR